MGETNSLVLPHGKYGEIHNDQVFSLTDKSGCNIAYTQILIRNMLLEIGEAVMSRSGKDCAVALPDRWYITYGEENWKRDLAKCSEGMHLYFENTTSSLNQWACSHSFGVGTRIPLQGLKSEQLTCQVSS